MPNKAGAPVQQVTTTPTEEWRSFRWMEPEVVTFKARDGADVYARLYTPKCSAARATARDPRHLRPRRRLHAERAQVLVDLLPRVHVPTCSPLLGTWCWTWTTAPAPATAKLADRDLPPHGGKDLDDIVDGAEIPRRRPARRPETDRRVRGSYGGFITLMALFTSPDTSLRVPPCAPSPTGPLQHGYAAASQ